jgi:hypothetical protein
MTEQDGPLDIRALRSQLERFRFKCCHVKSVRGGIFLRKMPLGPEDSVKSRIETAVAWDLGLGFGRRELK